MPTTLYATISNATGDCTCLEGTYELNYIQEQSQPIWAYTSTQGPCDFEGTDQPLVLYLYPNYDGYNCVLGLNCGNVEGGEVILPPTSLECDPFMAVYEITQYSFDPWNCCTSGSYTVTITE